MTGFHTRTRTRTSKGVNFLEFSLVMPFIMFFLVLSVDIGSAILKYAALQDAAYTTTRVSAQAGGAHPRTNLNVAADTLSEVVDHNKTLPQQGVVNTATPNDGYLGYIVRSGDKCTEGTNNMYVNIDVYYTPTLITPGLASVFKLSTTGVGGDGFDTWAMRASAVSRCEVVLP